MHFANTIASWSAHEKMSKNNSIATGESREERENEEYAPAIKGPRLLHQPLAGHFGCEWVVIE